jgi:hypothetical protein
MFLKSDHLRKLAQLKTPEDIARWREERKSNFPTQRRRVDAAESRVNALEASGSGSSTSQPQSNDSQDRGDKRRRNANRSDEAHKKRKVPLTLHEKVTCPRLSVKRVFKEIIRN